MGDDSTDIAAARAPGGLPLRASLLAFDKKTGVLRQSGVMDRSPMMAFEERHLGRDRFY